MQVRLLGATAPISKGQLNPNSNKNSQKSVSFQGIEGKVAQEFHKVAGDEFAEMLKGLKIFDPTAEQVNEWRKMLLNNKFIDKANNLIRIAPKTVTITAGKKLNVIPKFEKIEHVVMSGGRLFDETVKSLEMSGGVAENLNITQKLVATGGELKGVNIGCNYAEAKLSGATKASTMTLDLSGQALTLEGKASLTDSRLPAPTSELNLKDESTAENIVGSNANISDMASLKGFNNRQGQVPATKIVVTDGAGVEGFHARNVELNSSNPDSYIKDGKCDYLVVEDKGKISNVTASNALIHGPATVDNCRFNRLFAENQNAGDEKIIINNLTTKEADIGRNTVLNSPVVNDVLDVADNAIVRDVDANKIILRDQGQVIGGKTKILELHGDVRPQDLEVTRKVITYRKKPNHPEPEYDIMDQVYNAKPESVKRFFNLK